MAEPPPSDPEDLLHIELLPRGRARAATRHSRARLEEMAGGGASCSAVKAAPHRTAPHRTSLLTTARPSPATGGWPWSQLEYRGGERALACA